MATVLVVGVVRLTCGLGGREIGGGCARAGGGGRGWRWRRAAAGGGVWWL